MREQMINCVLGQWSRQTANRSTNCEVKQHTTVNMAAQQWLTFDMCLGSSDNLSALVAVGAFVCLWIERKRIGMP
jgi:hypothetical protein